MGPAVGVGFGGHSDPGGLHRMFQPKGDDKVRVGQLLFLFHPQEGYAAEQVPVVKGNLAFLGLDPHRLDLGQDAGFQRLVEGERRRLLVEE